MNFRSSWSLVKVLYLIVRYYSVLFLLIELFGAVDLTPDSDLIPIL
jgi:hypothetical protein